MPRSALCCDACGHRLAWQRPNGKLRVESDVLAVRFADGRVVLTCPACGQIVWRAAAEVWIVPPTVVARV